MLARFTVALIFTALLSASMLAAAPVVEPAETWSGKIKDESLLKIAPASGFIADAATWKRLWTAWRPGQKMPQVDFNQELVLVGTVSGPNLVIMRPIVDDTGNVKVIVGGTKIGGPGFGYKLVKMDREGVKTVNGKAVKGAKSAAENPAHVQAKVLYGPGPRDEPRADIEPWISQAVTKNGSPMAMPYSAWIGLTEDEQRLYTSNGFIIDGKVTDRNGNYEVEINACASFPFDKTVTLKPGERRVVSLIDDPPPNVFIALEAPASEQTVLDAEVGRADSRVRFLSEGKKTIIDINSEFGIDKATIRRQSNEWPKTLLVRLHLRGLASLKAGGKRVAVEWSVASTAEHPQRVTLRKGRDESLLDATSPYYSEVRVVGVNGKIPLEDGRFEIFLPTKLLEGNPAELTLRWIDFYRN